MRIPQDEPAAIGRRFLALDPELASAILTLIEAGWIRALEWADVHQGQGEVFMTERLRDGMRQVLEDQRFRWAKQIIVAPGTESRSTLAQVVPDGRTDIPLYVIELFFREGEHDPHAIIECKRIAGSDAHLCREYVVQGLDRFASGLYGENHAIGFMTGYVIAGDEAGAAAGVNRYLKGRSRLTEQLERTDALSAPYRSWRSHHSRAARGPIELQHAFLIPGAAAAT